MLRVQDVMTTRLITIRHDQKMQDALDLMHSHRISSLPVLNYEDQLVGLITEYSLLELLYDPQVAELSVGICMSKDPITVSPDTLVSDVVGKMALHRIRQVLVLDEQQRLVGLVSLRDLVHTAYQVRLDELKAAVAPIS